MEKAVYTLGKAVLNAYLECCVLSYLAAHTQRLKSGAHYELIRLGSRSTLLPIDLFEMLSSAAFVLIVLHLGRMK